MMHRKCPLMLACVLRILEKQMRASPTILPYYDETESFAVFGRLNDVSQC
jgi:hypothetical protein